MTKYFLIAVFAILLMQIRTSMIGFFRASTSTTHYQQRGSDATLPAGEDTTYVTITSVPMNRSALLVDMRTADGDTAKEGACAWGMISDTQFIVFRSTAGGSPLYYFNWRVITDSNFSNQHGFATMSSGTKSVTVAVSAVTVANTLPIINGMTSLNATWGAWNQVGPWLFSTTSLVIQSSTNVSGGDAIIGWQLWQSSTFTVTRDSSNTTTDTLSIAMSSDTDTTKQFAYAPHKQTTSTGGTTVGSQVSIGDRDELRYATSSNRGSCTIYAYRVEISDATVYPVTATFNTATTLITATIPASVNLDKSTIFSNGTMLTGGQNNSSQSNRASWSCTTRLSDATTVEFERGATNSATFWPLVFVIVWD